MILELLLSVRYAYIEVEEGLTYVRTTAAVHVYTTAAAAAVEGIIGYSWHNRSEDRTIDSAMNEEQTHEQGAKYLYNIHTLRNHDMNLDKIGCREEEKKREILAAVVRSKKVILLEAIKKADYTVFELS